MSKASQCRSDNFNIFNIRNYLSTESSIALVQSRLQYCNSLLINAKLKLYYRLHRVIKLSIRLILILCD